MRTIDPSDFEDLNDTLSNILPDGVDRTEARQALTRALAEIGVQAVSHDDLTELLQERILNALGMAQINSLRVDFEHLDMEPDPDRVNAQDGHWCCLRLFMPAI